MNDTTFITVQQLAERWHCNRLTIYRKKDKDTHFPRPYKKLGKGVLFKLKEIERYEESKRTK